MILTLPEIKAQVDQIAEKLGVSQGLLPTYGYSEQTGHPHLEVDSSGYHYVIAERGVESQRYTTLDMDELLYKIFADITFGIAASYEFKNRDEDRDCRRIIFRRQVELLAQLSSEWAAREAQEHEKILAKYPFDDAASVRADLCKNLRDQGNSPETAWKMACEQYPLPEGASW